MNKAILSIAAIANYVSMMIVRRDNNEIQLNANHIAPTFYSDASSLMGKGKLNFGQVPQTDLSCIINYVLVIDEGPTWYVMR